MWARARFDYGVSRARSARCVRGAGGCHSWTHEVTMISSTSGMQTPVTDGSLRMCAVYDATTCGHTAALCSKLGRFTEARLIIGPSPLIMAAVSAARCRAPVMIVTPAQVESGRCEQRPALDSVGQNAVGSILDYILHGQPRTTARNGTTSAHGGATRCTHNFHAGAKDRRRLEKNEGDDGAGVL